LPKRLARDNTMLLDMLEISTIQLLLNAFAKAHDIAVGMFTPDGRRAGSRVHHSEYCKLISSTPNGQKACDACDLEHMPKQAVPTRPYRCHANLLDFAVPIVAKKDNIPALIGCIGAGQLRPSKNITKKGYSKTKRTAKRYGIKETELLAALDNTRYLPPADIEKIQHLMKALADTIGQMATSRFEQHRLMQDLAALTSPAEVIRTISEFMKADACSIFTEDLGEPGHIYLRATSYEPLFDKIGKANYRMGQGLTGWIYKNGRTLNIKNLHDAEELRGISRDLHWKGKENEVSDPRKIYSYVGVPIRADDGRTIGVLRAVRIRAARFGPMQVETFETIGTIASAIVARLADAERRETLLKITGQASANVGLQKFVESFIEETARHFIPPADNIWVTRYLPDAHEFEIMAGKRRLPAKRKFPEDEGIAGYMLKHRLPYFNNNFRQGDVVSFVKDIRACIAYPIIFGEDFFGIIAVTSKRKNVFTSKDLTDLTLLGSQVTQAFHNAKQYEDERRESELHSAYLRCLYDISTAPPPWAPKSLIERVGEILNRHGNFGFIRAFVAEKDGILRCEKVWSSRKARERILGITYSEDDLLQENGLFRIKIEETQGELIGVLEVSRSDSSSSFSDFDRKCLGLVGELLSSRLRREKEVATAITVCATTSGHGLGELLLTPLDKIDTILYGGDDSLAISEEAIKELSCCWQMLNDAREWTKTSMLIGDYRRGEMPTASQFDEIDFQRAFQEAIEPALAFSNWHKSINVPDGTRAKVFSPGFRRIIRDLANNASEHGMNGSKRKIKAKLQKGKEGDCIKISISNISDSFTPQRAQMYNANFSEPEKMAFDTDYGIGLILAAIIAKVHGDTLKVTYRNKIVEFSFTIPVALQK